MEIYQNLALHSIVQSTVKIVENQLSRARLPDELRLRLRPTATSARSIITDLWSGRTASALFRLHFVISRKYSEKAR